MGREAVFSDSVGSQDSSEHCNASKVGVHTYRGAAIRLPKIEVTEEFCCSTYLPPTSFPESCNRQNRTSVTRKRTMTKAYGRDLRASPGPFHSVDSCQVQEWNPSIRGFLVLYGIVALSSLIFVGHGRTRRL